MYKSSIEIFNPQINEQNRCLCGSCEYFIFQICSANIKIIFNVKFKNSNEAWMKFQGMTMKYIFI